MASSRPSPRKARPEYHCSECGWTTSKWVGRCSECHTWGSVDETGPRAVGAVAGPVDEHEAAPARTGERALGHPGRERSGDAGVDGVPALGEDPRARLGGERVTGCDRSLHAASLERASLGCVQISATSVKRSQTTGVSSSIVTAPTSLR